MVFVSDGISRELRRIVEWLNEQLRSAEVLAIEITHFNHPNGVRTLIPHLLGATERANAVKAVTAQDSIVPDAEWIEKLESGLSQS